MGNMYLQMQNQTALQQSMLPMFSNSGTSPEIPMMMMVPIPMQNNMVSRPESSDQKPPLNKLRICSLLYLSVVPDPPQ
jgi:hypothetical protein